MILMPSVSIICPIHRPLNSLSKLSIVSILNQTYNHLDIFFCINGLPRAEIDSIKSYILSHNFHSYPIYFEISSALLSPGAARKLALKSISSDFIAFIDSDDISADDLVTTKINLASKHDLDLVVCSANIFDSTTTFINNSHHLQKRSYTLPLMALHLFKETWLPLSINFIPNSGTLLRRKNFHQLLFDYPTAKHEDFIFYSKLLSNSPRIGVIETPLISYFVSRKTTTGNKILSRLWHANAIRYIQPGTPLIFRYLIAFIGPLVIFIFLIFLRLLGLDPRPNQKAFCIF